MINSNKNKPIGIFDSGIGGTSIWKEIHELLPLEDTIYLSDSKNAPYGIKSSKEIRNLSIKNTDYLIENGCKIIVVACNTATTNAITYLRSHYNIPFIGIEPAIKPAALQSKTKKIGILATKGTLNSSLFEKTASNFKNDIEIIEQIGVGLVELIEEGKIYSNEMKSLLTLYLKPMIAKNIDHLVLGCTHYPYLIPVIKDIIGNKITIIDSGLAVARQTKNILHSNNLLRKTNNHQKSEFYINKDKQVLESIVSKYTNAMVFNSDF
ncbi:glutamate racemase [Tenacibaculum geojense]|uniref:Glutamate racemase n=1 Tax=Tenacibaculum geojense TaxID=915352 RepID=A0ABW3JR18_9FLAO